MISKSNIDVLPTLAAIKAAGFPTCFLVPTETGMKKSIMDATSDVRQYLKNNNIHDFASQNKGEQHKVCVDTALISKNEVIKTRTSLYRPVTKDGDPRIWVYGLRKNASAHDLLAIICKKEELIVINCSECDLSLVLSQKSSFSSTLPHKDYSLPNEAAELLNMLRAIGAKGFVKTLKSGDTGVGFTLESLLGIKSNSSQEPDWAGVVELKSSRFRSSKSCRTTIFSQVPNWEMSNIKSSTNLLMKRGEYDHKRGRHKLRHTISTKKPNTYKLQLELADTSQVLTQNYIVGGVSEIDTLWPLEHLEKRLNEKHSQTFWVYAETKGKSGDPNEEFHYTKAKYTSGADFVAFKTMLSEGEITVDYTLREIRKGVAKDQGYLFKINKKNLSLLFFHMSEYDLC